MQGEAADDDGEEEAGPAKKASKLASFNWASKLSDASSTGASVLQPGLLQSLTGTFAGTLTRTDAIAISYAAAMLPLMRLKPAVTFIQMTVLCGSGYVVPA